MSLATNRSIRPSLLMSVATTPSPLPERLLDIGAAAHLGERAVAVVVEQQARGGLEDARDAVELAAELVVAAREVAGRRRNRRSCRRRDRAGRRCRNRTRRRWWSSGLEDFGAEARLLADVGEGAVAVVVIENRPAVGGDEEVGKAVVVVVADGHAHAEGPAGDAGLLGDVGERAVAIVLVERVADRLLGLVEIARAAVDQVDVHPAVVVVVEEGAARSHGLRQVVFGRCGVVVDPANAAGLRRDLFEQGRASAA